MEPTSMGEPTISKIHQDSRGEMYAITLPGERELILLHSKAGALRGGHSHDVDEVVLLLTGTMRYYKRWKGHEQIFTMHSDGLQPVLAEGSPGMQMSSVSINPAGEVHMGQFLEDSWVLEWKVCSNKQSWTNTDYEPWRERVMAHAR